MANVLELRIADTLPVVGAPQRYAKQPKTRPAEVSGIADEVTAGAVADTDGVAEEAFVRIEDAVLVEVLGVFEAVVARAVRVDAAERVGGEPGLGLAADIPEPDILGVAPHPGRIDLPV